MQQIAERVFVETRYDGVNVGAVLTRKGFVCIDAPSYPRDARDWLTQLRQVDPRPVSLVILTSCHGDRIMNTRWFGAPLIAHTVCAEKIDSFDRRYPSPFVDSLVARNPDAGRELSPSPIERVGLSFSRDITLYSLEAPLQVLESPGPGPDAVRVELPKEGVVFAGDLVVAETHPILTGVTISSWLASLRALQKLVDEGFVIIPGRGPIQATGTLHRLSAYLADVQKRVSALAPRDLSRSDLNDLVSDLMECFPLGTLPREWVRAQLRMGLEYLHAQARVALRPKTTWPDGGN